MTCRSRLRGLGNCCRSCLRPPVSTLAEGTDSSVGPKGRGIARFPPSRGFLGTVELRGTGGAAGDRPARVRADRPRTREETPMTTGTPRLPFERPNVLEIAPLFEVLRRQGPVVAATPPPREPAGGGAPVAKRPAGVSP